MRCAAGPSLRATEERACRSHVGATGTGEEGAGPSLKQAERSPAPTEARASAKEMMRVDEHRFEELMRKRDRVGLSDLEADELGRALAEREGKPYSNARLERARQRRARPSRRGRRPRPGPAVATEMAMGRHPPDRRQRAGRTDARGQAAMPERTSLGSPDARIGDYSPGPLASVKTGQTSDPGYPQPGASEVESARLLGNQARGVLHAAGLTDRQIRRLADEFIAGDRGEDLHGFIEWALRWFQSQRSA